MLEVVFQGHTNFFIMPEDKKASGDGKCEKEKPKLKPCCACPETKKVRDHW